MPQRTAAVVAFLVVVTTACTTTVATLEVVPSATSASATYSPTPSPSVEVSALEGLWTTGQLDIEVIRHAMTDAGIPKAEVDAWVEEVAAPAWYSFELDFTGDRFEHLQATPDSAMEVDEEGTFTLEGDQLAVSITHDGEVDTYTFDVDRHDDDLALTWVSSTEQGEPGDKAHHRRYTIAFYCSATFHRQAT